MKKFTPFFFLVSVCCLIYACAKDEETIPQDDDYVALEISAVQDNSEVFQNAFIEIDVLANDENLPDDGTLEVTASENATLEIVGDSFQNSKIKYTPNLSFTGQDTFQYTVCTADGADCASAQVTVAVKYASPVNFQLDNIPYNTLSEYNFFEGNMTDQVPVFGVVPFEPISPLFTDYAKKKRFVWMPNGNKATFEGNDAVLNFPEGTILIKTFYYENVQPGNVKQLIETRLMIKKEGEWIFANYIWNEDQTEANLDASGNGGIIELEWIQDGELKNVNYEIPASSICLTCHKSFASAIPIGPKPQNLNKEFAYDDGPKNQLEKLIEYGYLEDNLSADISTVVDYNDVSQPLFERVRSYVDINCAHCHSESGHCNYRPLRLTYLESEDLANMGVCVPANTPIPGFDDNFLIIPGDKENSIFYYRMNTTLEEYRMPLRGRTLIHDESVDLIGEWIDSLTGTCD